MQFLILSNFALFLAFHANLAVGLECAALFDTTSRKVAEVEVSDVVFDWVEESNLLEAIEAGDLDAFLKIAKEVGGVPSEFQHLLEPNPWVGSVENIRAIENFPSVLSLVWALKAIFPKAKSMLGSLDMQAHKRVVSMLAAVYEIRVKRMWSVEKTHIDEQLLAWAKEVNTRAPGGQMYRRNILAFLGDPAHIADQISRAKTVPTHKIYVLANSYALRSLFYVRDPNYFENFIEITRSVFSDSYIQAARDLDAKTAHHLIELASGLLVKRANLSDRKVQDQIETLLTVDGSDPRFNAGVVTLYGLTLGRSRPVPERFWKSLNQRRGDVQNAFFNWTTLYTERDRSDQPERVRVRNFPLTKTGDSVLAGSKLLEAISN